MIGSLFVPTQVDRLKAFRLIVMMRDNVEPSA